MKYLLGTILIAASSIVMAEPKQDIIYKKDGSMLRGELIEQDFKNGVYKIELIGGSVFVVKESDIEKITKEESKAGSTFEQQNTEKELNRVAIESKATLQDQRKQSANTHQPTGNIDATISPKQIDNVIYVGTSSHIISQEQTINNGFYSETYTRTTTYSGIKLGFQRNLSKNIAIHFSFRDGSLKEMEITDEDDNVVQRYSGSQVNDTDHLGISTNVLISTNHYQGFQLFTGLGVSHDNFSNQYYDDSYTSLLLDLGLGYAWQQAQLGLHYQGYIAGDYPDELDVANIHLQLGFHF